MPPGDAAESRLVLDVAGGPHQEPEDDALEALADALVAVWIATRTAGRLNAPGTGATAPGADHERP